MPLRFIGNSNVVFFQIRRKICFGNILRVGTLTEYFPAPNYIKHDFKRLNAINASLFRIKIVQLTKKYLTSVSAMKGYKELVEMEKKRKPARPTTAANNLKQIGRGFSMSNVQLVQQARDNLVIEERHVDDNTLEKLAVTSRRSFVLPDITQFGKVLAAFIREDLISATAMTALTTKGSFYVCFLLILLFLRLLIIFYSYFVLPHW